MVIPHHPELGAIGLWLPQGGVQTSPGNQIQIHNSRVKVATPIDILREIHNIRGVVAIEDIDALSLIAKKIVKEYFQE